MSRLFKTAACVVAVFAAATGALAEVPAANSDINGKTVYMAAGARLRYEANLLGRVYTRPTLPLELVGRGACTILFCPVTHNKVALYASRLRLDTAKPLGGLLTDRTVRRGDEGDDVTNVQKALNGKGYASIVADGKFGRGTETAVKDFQRKSGLEADGAVGPATRKALGI